MENDTAYLLDSEANSVGRELIEKLLEFSERQSQEIEEEDYDRVVFTSSLDEVACGWKDAAPNVRYISSADRKKKTKEKYWRVSPDSESNYSKVKRLAGMITNSNSSSGSEINNVKAGGMWPGNRQLKANMRNFQNADVLSYDTPCWRYIIDPRTLKYVERTPLQVLRNMFTSHKYPNQTLVLENGGIITFQETSSGGIAISDPALSFDRRLLESFQAGEDYRLCADKVCRIPGSYETSVPLVTQFRTEDKKIKVVHAVPPRKESNPTLSVCELCRFRAHDLSKSDCRLEVNSSSCTELKPLQKITPIQRQTADDAFLASKALQSQTKLKSENTSCSKVCRKSKEHKNQKKRTGPGGEGKLDWLPITRNTIGYPYPTYPSSYMTASHGNFPERPSAGFSKAFSLPRHNKKGKKLTLSEAANLVPSKGKLNDALEKLTQELDRKVEKARVTISETLLPSVSGTKLEVALANYCEN